MTETRPRQQSRDRDLLYKRWPQDQSQNLGWSLDLHVHVYYTVHQCSVIKSCE